MSPPAPPDPGPLRRAGPPDAPALARVGADTFVQAFADVNTPEDMAAYVSSAFDPARLADELADPANTFLIAEADGRPVAYAKLRRGAAPACVVAERPIELARFYVDRTRHGTGLAHDLIGEALRIALAESRDALWLGVWEHNPRALAFYRKWSFEPVGRQPFLLGSDLQTDLVLVRALQRSPFG